jgi:Flp pilus assembly protein TadG
MISIEAWFTWVAPLIILAMGLTSAIGTAIYAKRAHRRADEMEAAERRAAEESTRSAAAAPGGP